MGFEGGNNSTIVELSQKVRYANGFNNKISGLMGYKITIVILTNL